MHISKGFLYLIAASALSGGGATAATLHTSKEESFLSSAKTQLLHAQHTADQAAKHDPDLQRKAFIEREKNRHELPKRLSETLKDALLDKFIRGDVKDKGGVKAKVSKFLFNQKTNKLLHKIWNMNGNKNGSSRRTNQEIESQHFAWPSFRSASVSRDHDGDGSSYYQPISFGDIFDEISMVVMSINQTEYSEVIEGLLSVVGDFVPSPEVFCADFDVTTTEDECIAAVSSVVTLVGGAIRAPWLIRDILGYVEAWINEVVAWETLEGIAGGLMSMYGADGTIDGGLGAIRGLVSDLYALVAATDPYFSYYYPEAANMNMGGLFFDTLPLTLAADVLVWDNNMLEYFGDVLYETVYALVEGITLTLGEGYIDMPEGPEFHADLCEAFGLVPANITTVVSCDYFGDIGQEDLVTEDVNFCVETGQDMEDYSAELFNMESTFDSDTLDEMSFGWIIENLQYQNWKFDNYNFSALESMTCSIKGRLTQEVVCNEKPLNTFLYKDGEERTCKWLRNRKHTKRICENFETARFACPSTCCLCDEDPMELFFRKYIEEDGVKVPEMKTCKWLSSKTPENLERFCQKKNFAPPGLKVASGACPVTCGLCEGKDEGKDECQDAIDEYITHLDGVGYIYHSNYSSWWEPYHYVYVGDFGESYSSMYYSDSEVSYTLGRFYERDGNTFLYGDGDSCGEDEQFSSKLIVESTKNLALNGTSYLYQSSPCNYELKLLTFCNTTDATNTTNVTGTSFRNLFEEALKYFYPQPEDEVLDWQK